jgi:hypothetical protein
MIKKKAQCLLFLKNRLTIPVQLIQVYDPIIRYSLKVHGFFYLFGIDNAFTLNDRIKL